ncbi:coiled-coil domain-containing protein 122-like [Carassius auratus]|uniref:Coiled-coil domain-containing protein 122-like n=1 Tax=Carassius auratus TaxID=7957 RepID=A0A6P6KEI7_CARAU|nr:coiled-coil domain-containing protein 122-like [Carassius auratus]
MEDHRQKDFPLNDALHELLQQGATRASQLRDAQREHDTLQASLLQLDRSCESVCSQVKLKEKMLTALQCDVEQLQRSVLRLDAQIHSVLLENLELRNCTEEHQERRRSQQTEFSSHRSRMRDYRTAVCLQDSRAHLHQELQQKQQEASGLRHTLDELKTDLQKPDASAVRQTQKDIDLLQASIRAARQTVLERKAHLENEHRTQTQLRREIEIQERRCEAILKRLRSQLKKAQSGHRQLRSDITHLQTQLDELRGQLDAS